MKYETYKEEFLKKQVELVKEVTEKWERFNYPDAEQLKETYSQEGFTADTRHYLFDDDKLIAIMASAVERKDGDIQYGSIQLPFIRGGYDTEKIEKKLMNKALAKLKEKGVDVVYTNLYDKWPMKEFIKRQGYGNKSIVSRQVFLTVKDVDFSDFEKPDYIQKFDWDSHMDMFFEAVQSVMELEREQFETIIKTGNDQEYTVIRLVIIKDGKFVGQGRLSVHPEFGATIIPFIYAEGKEKYRAPLIKELYKYAKKHELKPEQCVIFQLGNDTNSDKGYEEFDFETIKTYRYEIDLKE